MKNLYARLGTLSTILALTATTFPPDCQAHGPVQMYVGMAEIVDMPPGGTYFLGAQITISCLTWNGGTEPSGDYTISYYLYKGDYINKRDYLLGRFIRGSLNPDESEQVTATLTLPSDYPRGYMDVKVVALSEKESFADDHNTEYIPRVRIVPAHPDLIVSDVYADDETYGAGYEVTVRVSIKNAGGVSSGGYSVEYYAGDYRIGSAGREDLPLDGVDTFDTKCKLPDDIPDGNYPICVKASCADDYNPANNQNCGSVSIHVRPFSDLALQSLQVAPGAYVPGGQIHPRSIIASIGRLASEAYTVNYYLSRDPTITPSDQRLGSATRSGLAQGQEDIFETICRLPPYIPEGNCYVGAILTCSNDGYTGNNQAMDSLPVKIVYANGYVCGRITYKDLEGWQHPVRYARVNVYDADDNSDPLDDREIGEAYTDQDGNYGVLVLKDEKSGPQVYVKAFTQAVPGVYPGTTSGICSVRDDVLHEVYSLKSPLYSHPRDASLTANLTALDSGGEFMVYDSVIEGFHKAKTFFGLEPNEIITYWPSSDNGTYYDPNGGIHIGREDRGDRDVIMHEYGHYIAQLGNFAQGDDGGHPMHYWRIDLRYSPSNRIEEHARNLAFREAWATLFSIATQRGEVGYPYSGDDKYQDYNEKLRTRFTIDLERETRYHSRPGEFYENMNTAVLWDIFDDNNDGYDDQDTLSDTALAKIWTVLQQGHPDDISDFWNAWFERCLYVSEMMRIFKDHGMSFKYLGPSPTVEGFETGDFKAFAWVHLGDQPWSITSDVWHQGRYSARAGTIGNRGRSTLEITAKVDDGWIRFWCKTSTEEGLDKLVFFIDGTTMGVWSGEQDWKQAAIAVRAGTHVFTWTYAKDATGTAGTDAAWLDDIEFPIW